MVIFKGGHPKIKKLKLMDFFKLPDTICDRKGDKTHFRAHYLFWQKLFGTQTVKTRNNHKDSGFSGNCSKLKMTFFLKRCFFDMGEKFGFY